MVVNMSDNENKNKSFTPEENKKKDMATQISEYPKSFLKDFLGKYMDLTEKESDIYLSLLFFGSLTDGELELHTGYTLEDVRATLSSLVGKKIVKEITGVVTRYRVLPPFLGVARFLEENGTKLAQMGVTLSENTKKKMEELREKAELSEKEFSEKLNEINVSLQRDIDEKLASLDASTQQMLANISEEIQKLTSELEAAINNLRESTNAVIKKTIREYTDEATKRKEELILKSEALQTQVDNLSKETKSTVVNVATETRDKLIEAVTDVTDGIKHEVDSFKTSVDSLIKTEQEELATLKENLNTDITQIITGSKESLNSYLDSVKLSFEKYIASDAELLKSTLSGLSSALFLNYDKITNAHRTALQGYTDKLSSVLTEGGNNFASIITDFDNNIIATLSKSKQDAEKQLEQLVKNLEKTKSDSLKTIKSTTGASQKDIAERFQESEKSLTTLSQTLVQGLEKSMNNLSSTYSMYSDDVQKMIISALDEALTNIQSAFENIKRAVIQKAESSKAQLSNISSSVSNTVSTTTTQLANVYKSHLVASQRTIESLLETNYSTAETLLNFASEKATNLANGIKNSVFEQLLKSSDDIRKKLNTMTKKTKDSLEKHRSELISSLSQYDEEISKNYQDTKTYVNELINKTINAYSQNANNLRTEVNNTVVKAQDDTTGKYTELQSAVASRIETYYNDLNTKFTGLSNEIARVASDVHQRLDTMKATSEQEISSLSSSIEQNLENFFTSTKTSLKELIDSTSSIYTTYAESLNSTVKSIFEQARTDFGDVFSATQNNNSTFLESTKNRIESLISEFKTNSNTLMKDYSTTISTAVNDFTTNSAGGLLKIVNVASDDLLNAAQEILNFVNETKTRIIETNKFLDSAWEYAAEVPSTIAEKTWHIVGKEAVLNRMKDMIRRTKTMVTIVLPKIDDIPVDVVKESKKTQKINIVVNVGGNKAHPVIKELISMPNVRVWHRDAKDYYACTRDGEEVLLAPAIGSDKQLVALVSEKEEYVLLMHKFVGPMWMASSEEIKAQ